MTRREAIRLFNQEQAAQLAFIADKRRAQAETWGIVWQQPVVVEKQPYKPVYKGCA